jgi:hypothetical protein
VSFNCPVDADGKADRAEFTSASKICFAPAKSYGATYEAVALCTTNPETEIRAGRDLDNVCHYLLTTSDTPIVVNSTNTSSYSFEATLPPEGTYTHAFIMTKNEYTVTGEIEFNGTIYGTNEARNNWGVGNFCGPPIGAYKISTLYNNVLTGGTLLSTCYATSKGDSPLTGTLTVDSLTSSGFDADIDGVGILLDASGAVATNESAAKSYINSHEFDTPFTVSPNTTNLIYGVSMDQALRMITIPAGSLVVGYLTYLGDVNFKVEAN